MSLQEAESPHLYFDNAAIGLPRSPEVLHHIAEYLENGGTYGRSAYPRTAQTTRLVEQCRRAVATLINASSPTEISFFLNATDALNGVILHFPYRKMRILISPLEHNAVMRPLQHLADTIDLQIDSLPAQQDGTIAPLHLQEINPDNYDLLIVNHTSNVNGVVQPVREIRTLWPQIPLLLDASQSVGHLPMDVQALQADWTAFSAHKGLNGPTGVGILHSRGKIRITPHRFGGTGSNSASYYMPENYPDRNEAGTPNILGIIGLLGALETKNVPKHSQADYLLLLERIEQLPAYTLLKPNDPQLGIELFSMVPQNGQVANLARKLAQTYGIEVRSGLHCAPAAHKYLNTFPHGTVRFALSPQHTPQDLAYLTDALKALNNTFLNAN